MTTATILRGCGFATDTATHLWLTSAGCLEASPRIRTEDIENCTLLHSQSATRPSPPNYHGIVNCSKTSVLRCTAKARLLSRDGPSAGPVHSSWTYGGTTPFRWGEDDHLRRGRRVISMLR